MSVFARLSISTCYQELRRPVGVSGTVTLSTMDTAYPQHQDPYMLWISSLITYRISSGIHILCG